MTKFAVDLTQTTAKFTRPALLTHPNIPSPARGLNPRTVKGQEWWDVARRKAYGGNNYCCWACGTPAGDDPYQPQLHAHECYDIDSEQGTLRLLEVVALCYSCHNFIHSGRLYALMRNRKIPRKQVEDIIFSRMKMVEDASLKPFYGTKALWYHLKGPEMSFTSALFQVRDEGLVPSGRPAPRAKWRLIIGDEVYDFRGQRVRSPPVRWSDGPKKGDSHDKD